MFYVHLLVIYVVYAATSLNLLYTQKQHKW
jgi:hypothetical protein